MDQLLALRAFVRIAETGAFAKASDSLAIPRPTVTKLVQELEAHLGVKLLQRTTRRVNVTAEGAAYYERAVRLIGDLEDMDSLVAHTRKLPRGHLRVDIGSSLANLILLPALPRFRALYPDITLSIGVSDRPLDLIESGVDCVIRGGALADTSLVARRLAELDYVTCASPAYLATRGVPTHPVQLQTGHELFGYFSSLTGRSFPMLFARDGQSVEIATPAQTAVNESTAHLTGLLAGLGVGQTFGFMARPHFARGALTQLMEDWDRPHHPMHLLYPPNRHLQAKLRVFVDWVVEVFAPYDWRG
jgi:DNA-binding transcriptional LysR family regulator